MKRSLILFIVLMASCGTKSLVKSDLLDYNLKYIENAQKSKNTMLKKLSIDSTRLIIMKDSYFDLFKECRQRKLKSSLFNDSHFQSLEYLNFPEYSGYFWNNVSNSGYSSFAGSNEAIMRCKSLSKNKIPFKENLISYFNNRNDSSLVLEDNVSQLFISEINNDNEFNKSEYDGIFIYSKFELVGGKIQSHEVMFFKLKEVFKS